MERKRCNRTDFWDMVRISNDETTYPSNMGLKWSEQEETMLLQELKDDIDIETIAKNHDRTVGGINARRREIAYQMHLKKTSFDEIIQKTKLDYQSIENAIQRKKEKYLKRKTKDINKNDNKNDINNVFISINKNDYIEMQTDVQHMKNDIHQMKTTLKELVEMMKALYEFESA